MYAANQNLNRRRSIRVLQEKPNAETRAALEEVREMEAHPERFKSYRSLSELLNEVLTDA